MSELVGEGAGGLENVVSGEKTSALVWLLSLLGLSIALPFFHLQMVTGPLVNAILFIATVVLGWRKALWICLIPSVIAFSVGLLPTVLGPAIPFIMLSNMILVVIFNPLWKKNWWLGVAVASVAKFIFLFGASKLLFGRVDWRRGRLHIFKICEKNLNYVHKSAYLFIKLWTNKK